MENEILLYPNKKGLEGVIALTRTRPLIAQALNRRAGQEGPTHCRPGWTRLLAACNRLQTAPPAFIESARVPATRPSASRPAFLDTKNDQNIINYAWSWLVVLTLVAGTRGFSLFTTLLNFFGFEVNHGCGHYVWMCRYLWTWVWCGSWTWNVGLARELYHVQCFVCYCLESNCCYYMTRKKTFCATSVDARTSQQACWLDKHLNLAIMKEILYWQQF